MDKTGIDTYKLTSLEEPSDDALSQIMKEVAADAQKKGEEANQRFFSELRNYSKSSYKDWISRNKQ